MLSNPSTQFRPTQTRNTMILLLPAPREDRTSPDDSERISPPSWLSTQNSPTAVVNFELLEKRLTVSVDCKMRVESIKCAMIFTQQSSVKEKVPSTAREPLPRPSASLLSSLVIEMPECGAWSFFRPCTDSSVVASVGLLKFLEYRAVSCHVYCIYLFEAFHTSTSADFGSLGCPGNHLVYRAALAMKTISSNPPAENHVFWTK